jgi:LysM repeat protein
MSKKLLLVVILGLTFLLVLASCERAASQSSQTSLSTQTPPSLGVLAQPTGMSQLQMIGTTQSIQTQTAMYQATQGSSVALPGTQQPLFTSTPTGSTAIPNTFTLVPPTGVAGTPVYGGTPVGITPYVTAYIGTPIPVGRPASYTLMEGEFPYCIARRFNVNQQELFSINSLANGELYQPGTVLQIPQSGNPFVGERALHAHPDTYTVTAGDDTIYKVACYYGSVDPTQIIAANGLISPYTLHVNQALSIP